MLRQKTPLRAKTTLRAKTGLHANTALKAKSRLQSSTKLKSHSYKKTVEDNTLGMAFPKFSRVRNQSVIDDCKRDTCEICGARCYRNEPHHIISRGAGGPDIQENLIQLCPKCHREVHDGKYDNNLLFRVVASRLHKSQQEVEETIRKVRGRT